MSAAELGTTQDLQARLAAIVESAVHVLSADGGAVVLLGPHQPQPTLEAVHGLAPADVNTFLRQEGAKIVDEGIHSRQPSIHNDLGPPDAGAVGGEQRIKACVSIPLVTQDQVVGALQVYSGARVPAFHAEDIEVINSLAREASLAIENSRLSQIEREQHRRTGILLEIARATTSSLKLEEVLDRVVEKTATLTGADRCSIWLLDRDGVHLISASIYGIDEGFASAWRRRNIELADEALSREALASLQPVVVLDARNDPRTDKRAVEFFGDRSILVVPLVYKDTPLGTLFLNHIREQHYYTNEETESIVAIASQAAVAIQNAKLYEESRQKSEALEKAFSRIGAALASTTNTDEMLQLVVDAVADLLHAPFCGIQLLDENTMDLTFRSSRGFPQELMRDSRVKLGRSLGGKVLALGHALRVEAADEQVQLFTPAAKQLGIKEYIGVPLFIKGRPMGVLGVYSTQVRQLSEQDLELLRSFANQAAVGIEKAALFDETRRRAHDLALLHDASVTINSSLEMDKVLEVVVNTAMRLTDADIGSLFVIDEETGTLVEKVTVPPDRRYGTEIRPAGLTSLIISTGEGVIITDTRDDPRVNPAVVEKGIRSLLGMPMKADQGIMGVLYLNASRPHHFSEANRDILSVLVNQAAVALRNANLYNGVVQEKEKLAAIFKNSTDGILMMDANRRILALNLALEQMIGWKTDEVIGLPCEEVFQCQDLKENTLCQTGCPMAGLVGVADTVPYVELSLRRRNGEPVQVAASYSQIPSPAGGTWLWVSIMRDITEMKRVEQLKSDFVAIVSHELRTPLSIIKGYSSTMLRQDLSFDRESQRRFIASIDEAADRLTRLMNDLLSISRIEMGKLELHLGYFDLNAAIRKVAGECTFSRSNSHYLELDLWPAAITICADRVRIEEVIQNLLDNAMKYSPAGSTVKISSRVVAVSETTAIQRFHARQAGTKTLATGKASRKPRGQTKDEPGGRRVIVSVADQGVGMTEEQRRHVFEKFYRAEGGLSRRTSGMGLGLFLSKGLVEAHGGEIWVESLAAGGSVFHFSLPLSDDCLPAQEAVPEAAKR